MARRRGQPPVYTCVILCFTINWQRMHLSEHRILTNERYEPTPVRPPLALVDSLIQLRTVFFVICSP